MTGPYHPRMSLVWWLKSWHYARFMLRELTSVFVAGYAVLLLVLVTKVYRGPADFEGYLDFLKSPGLLALHAVVFLFVLFHTLTWFSLAPKALVVWRGEEQVPPRLIAAAHFMLWLVISALVALLFLV